MILLLRDNGWTIWASGWSAAVKGGDFITVSYVWHDGWTGSVANGVSSVSLNMRPEEFGKRLKAASTVCDLREFCTS